MLRSSGCRTCRGCSTPTTRSRRSPRAGRTALGLHQLFPLLVHACLFGGGYGARAAADRSRPATPLTRSQAIAQASLASVGAGGILLLRVSPSPACSSSTTTGRCASRCAARWSSTGTTSRWPPTAPRRSPAIGAQHPDVVVMDVMMPRLDGIEATRALRAAGNDVPILVLTARDAVGDRVEGLDAGADDYLTKPFALQELLARLRALLRRVVPARRRRRARCSPSPTSPWTSPPARWRAATGRSS